MDGGELDRGCGGVGDERDAEAAADHRQLRGDRAGSVADVGGEPGCGETACDDLSKISIPFLIMTAQAVLQRQA
jgi:hypothetical protein